MSPMFCKCGQFALANKSLCEDCIAEILPENPETKLKVFKVDLEPDFQIDKQGFFLVILAKDLDQAKVFAQAEFNTQYDGVIDVFTDEVRFTEIEGPFPAGKILVSLHY